MIKIIGVIFSTLICSILLKNKQPYFSLLISITGSLIAISFVIDQIRAIKQNLVDYSNEFSTFSPYILLMIKILIIVLITQFVSDLCNDNGNSALGNITEISSKIIIVTMCLPLFENVLNIVLGFVK